MKEENSKAYSFSVEVEADYESGIFTINSISLTYNNKLYEFTKDSVLYMDGIRENMPYYDYTNNIEINYYGHSRVFSSEMLQLDWDGNENIQIYLCKEFKDQVCGLCGM